MINVFFMLYTKYLCSWVVIIRGFYIRFNNFLYNRTMSICSCSLVKSMFPIILNVCVYKDMFDSLNYFEQYIIQIMLPKIEILAFHATQNLTKANQTIIQITRFNQ